MNIPEQTESINIRKAQANDVEFVCELLFGLKSMYASCTETSLDAFSKNYMAAIEQALKSPTNSIWVAQTPGGEIVGFISMTRRLVLRLAGEVGVLEEIFVRQDYRRRGVGYKLWQYAIEDYATENKNSRSGFLIGPSGATAVRAKRWKRGGIQHT